MEIQTPLLYIMYCKGVIFINISRNLAYGDYGSYILFYFLVVTVFVVDQAEYNFVEPIVLYDLILI